MTIELTNEQVNIVLAALNITSVRYNTEHNGGIHYDFTFQTIQQQNDYAKELVEADSAIRKQLPVNL